MLIVHSLLAAAAALPPDATDWETLTLNPVKVECAQVDGAPWCRSYGIVRAPLDQVAQSLRDMRHSAHLFESVLSIETLSDDALHITLDYPTPLDDRDYVARYSHGTDGDAQVFAWVPVQRPDAPETDAAVRLPRFEGEWRLEPRGDATWVRYTWQAEIAGRFPSWGYETAWKRAGHEALRDLARTRSAALEPAE